MKKKRKHSITLIEIMIVIFLIGIISSALAFNMRGSVDQGKIFQSEQKSARIYDILMMEYAQSNMDLEDIVESYEEIVKKSPLMKNDKNFLFDAWGDKLIVKLNKDKDDIIVFSEKVSKYQKKKKES